MTIKAIETNYNGYRFRSRLEARWAVFFDTVHIPYLYESEGYDLDGVWYLPDFWLPTQETFVEIKGQEPTDAEMDKAYRLCDQSRRSVAVLVGDPWYTPAYALLRNILGDVVNLAERGDVRWRTCSVICSGCTAECMNTPALCVSIAPNDFGETNSSVLQRAYTTARQARF